MLLVAAVGAVVWFFIAPGERFLPAFVRLLTENFEEAIRARREKRTPEFKD